MTPEASPILPLPGSEEMAARRSFRRGRVLVWAVVLVTAVFLFQGSVREVWSRGFQGGASDRITGWITQAILCWLALRGGRFATGCFTALYGVILVAFATITAFIVASLVSPADPSPDFDLGFGSMVFAFLQAAWAAFALWVLLLSRDARFYAQMRREGIADADADAFTWPPAHRRQE